MLKQTIKKWNQSIEFYENGNIGESLKTICSIESTTSKINYNIGVMYIKNNNYKQAIEYFSRSIEQDKYLAASYFMRAISHHMGGELNHAIVDYDETISKLRGHEFIDYKQLGLDHKLLLAEVLFNKALALGRAGSSVAIQATQCYNLPNDSNEFKNQCKRIQEGSSNFSTRPIPLNLLFKPPKVSDGTPKQRSVTTSSVTTTSSTSSPSLSSSPLNSYVLKGPTVSTPSSSSSSSSTTALPPKPPSQSIKPSFGSPSPSSSSPSSPPSTSPITNRTLPPKPPPLPSKKLPSRPISCLAQEVKITLKVTYNDRRLIQIPVPCNFSTFIQKIESKFEISVSNKISLSFELDGEETIINSQVSLDKMICMEIKDILIKDIVVLPDSFNEEKPKSSYSRPIKQTTTSSSSSSNTTNYFTLPRNTNLSTYSGSSNSTTTSTTNNTITTKPRSNTPVGPPIPARNVSPLSPSSKSQAINIPPVPTSSRPKLTQSHSPPSSYSTKTTATTTTPSLSSSFGGLKSPPVTPYPYKVMFLNGEKYYLNTETNETFWTIPG